MAWDAARRASLRRLTWIVRGGVIAGIAGTAWTIWPAQDANASFRPRVAAPAFAAPQWPRLVIDEGHANVHTAGGRYSPFARLMELLE